MDFKIEDFEYAGYELKRITTKYYFAEQYWWRGAVGLWKRSPSDEDKTHVCVLEFGDEASDINWDVVKEVMKGLEGLGNGTRY